MGILGCFWIVKGYDIFPLSLGRGVWDHLHGTKDCLVLCCRPYVVGILMVPSGLGYRDLGSGAPVVSLMFWPFGEG